MKKGVKKEDGEGRREMRGKGVCINKDRELAGQ